MEFKRENAKKYISLLIALGVAYLITGIFLMLTAYISFKMGVSENVMTAMITVTYLVSTAIGGFVAGKGMRTKKYIWGLLTGLIYSLIICLISVCVYHDSSQLLSHGFIVVVLCSGGGMLGGMIS